MLSVLINAYACAPNRGSEPGMAWNWIINLANHCKLHVITEGEWQSEIEEALALLPQGKNITFYYNPVSDKIRNMCWNQGDWRFYYFYQKWQKLTLKIATEIIQHEHIDVVHQLNMIGFREPGYLWKIGKPFIWGPTNAKEGFPTAYLMGADFKSRIFIYIKNFLNRVQLTTSIKVKNAITNSSFVIAASTDSGKAIKKFYHINPVILNESGCYLPTQKPIEKKKGDDNFNLVWVGRFIFTKQLDLALKAISILQIENIRLHIVGGSERDEKKYKNRASELNIAEKCIWHGKVSHSRVQELMQASDVFLFTSVAEGTPHVVLEALTNKLPVLCFNTCGQGDSVNDKVGVKIELSNPEQSVKEFANKLDYLYHNPQVLDRLSENCAPHIVELSWQNKAIKMIDLYSKSIYGSRKAK